MSQTDIIAIARMIETQVGVTRKMIAEIKKLQDENKLIKKQLKWCTDIISDMDIQ